MRIRHEEKSAVMLASCISTLTRNRTRSLIARQQSANSRRNVGGSA